VSRRIWIFGVISTVTALLMASVAVAFAAQGGGDRGQERMTVCHKGHTLTVPAPALAAHERHGDTAGDCPDEEAGTPEDPESTTPDDPESTTPDSAAGNQYGQEKVTICHKGHTLTVAAPALPAHERHGDVEGACATEDVGDGGTDDDAGAGAEGAVHEEVVDGSFRGQDLYGDSAANRLRGTTRADFLQSGRGPDIVFGNVGNDYIDGVDGISGNDLIDGGRGIDHCVGDEGDTFRYCEGNVVEVPSGTPPAHLTVN
jgi:hypothetical protein